MEQTIIRPIVPAFSLEKTQLEKCAQNLTRAWEGTCHIPAAKTRVKLLDGKACDDTFLSHNPTDAWTLLSKNMRESNLKLLGKAAWKDHEYISATDAPPEDMLRIVCISDTHGKHDQIDSNNIPDGDILIHAGDLTNKGEPATLRGFRDWVRKLPHKHKLVIGGNHDLSLDKNFRSSLNPESIKNARDNVFDVEEFIYLCNDSITLEGYNFFGSPIQPEFNSWAFQRERGQESRNEWNQIPDETDVLITHGPPLGFGDLCKNGCRAGCLDLLREVQFRVRPIVHVFGHIHEGYGHSTDGQTLFLNASSCDYFYRPTNPIHVFDLPKRRL
mmetsp:Transcript_12631/g.14485  ORF Transcript_12631/g.14485 Transcript_12631/m.14485 type:complete len:329 (+) Transcript_12631:70-1056(+)